jgi:DNA modification methylase
MRYTIVNIYNNLITIFNEVHRVLKQSGSCWINIADVYSSDNKSDVKKQSLIGIPDRLKIAMIDNGWICRNEVIWHKPNAMPSSAKTRFNNDYEKFYFFTKDDLYYFDTQYEEAKTKLHNKSSTKLKSKYESTEQESSVRQGMNRERGTKLIEIRPKLPEQQIFVDFIRKRTTVNQLESETKIRRTKIEHWFRRDVKGFAYPNIEDWQEIKYLLDDFSEEFMEIDYAMTYVEYETDDINKNLDKGRIKRAVWSINTKPFKGGHFAQYPEELIETPIKACCPNNGIVLDPFMGSGTTGVVAKKLGLNYIGIDLNQEYIKIANERIKTA